MWFGGQAGLMVDFGGGVVVCDSGLYSAWQQWCCSYGIGSNSNVAVARFTLLMVLRVV